MTFGLKTTLLTSCALAASLNCIQFVGSYNQHAQASFNPGSIEAASGQATTAAGSATKAVITTPVPSPAPLIMAAPTSSSTPVEAAPVFDAAQSPAIAAQAKLSAAGLKPNFAANYLEVQAKTGTPWQLLAAVHRIESGQSGDTSIRSSAGALGPMQFMPATFAHYAQDGDGNGTKQITDFDDALLTAGRYLAAGGADKGKYTTALYNYNHSNSYVNNVLTIAKRLGL